VPEHLATQANVTTDIATHNTDVSAHTYLTKTDGSRRFTNTIQGVRAVATDDLATLGQIQSTLGSGLWEVTASGYEANSTSGYFFGSGYVTTEGPDTAAGEFSPVVNIWDKSGNDPDLSTFAEGSTIFIAEGAPPPPNEVDSSSSISISGFEYSGRSRFQNAWVHLTANFTVNSVTGGTATWTATQTNLTDGTVQFASGTRSTAGSDGTLTFSGQLPADLDASELVVTVALDNIGGEINADLDLYSVSVFDYYTDIINPGTSAISPSGVTTQVALGTSGWYDSHALVVVGDVGISGNLSATTISGGAVQAGTVLSAIALMAMSRLIMKDVFIMMILKKLSQFKLTELTLH
jgi:hypothetical protein